MIINKTITMTNNLQGMIIIQENWIPILNHEEYYEISNTGKIRNKKTKNEITGDYNNIGYRRVILYNPIKKRYFVHRLVALHFCDGYEEGLVVNHKDGNKSNNVYSNLEWVTRSENDIHAFNNNLRKINCEKKVAKFDLNTREIIEIYKSIKEAAEQNNSAVTSLSYVCNGHYKQNKGYGYKFI